MAEPVLRDPVPPEPVRRRGPQPVRAATAKVSPPEEPDNKVHVEKVQGKKVQVEPMGAVSADFGDQSGTLSTELPSADPGVPVAGATVIDSPIIDSPVTGGAINDSTIIGAPIFDAPVIDPAHELPPPSSTTGAEPLPSKRAPAAGGPHSARSRGSAKPPKGRSPSQEMLDELRGRLDELRERVERQAAETSTNLQRELGQDADYFKLRARYYHQRRPIQAVGMVAAGSFVLGLFIGLWRR